ncbi:alpha-ribazole phosphatase [Marinitoga sp. 1197]|uniref:alpha-ribazole phosphatase n=1 Tax=unclassified Marinitoga TaxID=2640159 RepID=UPI00064170CF|nr:MULTISPECIES: alpha-ribazole phosphatase [unclassified Marinitoga]KLO22304.1 alpha-ribazole phosphatase [Marinitoga sp. 1155]KLO22963.1 alpha-ribazole phosphatase [Marinitoga sp. 1197]
MNLILIRHGETEANVKKIYSGWSDFPLTKKGKIQIEIIKEKIRDKKIDKIYSSPLKRSYYTALEVAKIFNIKVEKREELKEINFGYFEGKNIETIQREYENEYIKWIRDYKNFIFPGGESFIEFYNRVVNFIEKKKNENKTYLIVSHCGVIRIIIVYLLRLDIDKMWNFSCDFGSLIEIEYKNNFGILKKIC